MRKKRLELIGESSDYDTDSDGDIDDKTFALQT